jgi:hypothetical protein
MHGKRTSRRPGSYVNGRSRSRQAAGVPGSVHGELRTAAARKVLADLVRRAKGGRDTLVYGSRATEIGDVAVLERLLRRRLSTAMHAN